MLYKRGDLFQNVKYNMICMLCQVDDVMKYALISIYDSTGNPGNRWTGPVTILNGNSAELSIENDNLIWGMQGRHNWMKVERIYRDTVENYCAVANVHKEVYLDDWF